MTPNHNCVVSLLSVSYSNIYHLHSYTLIMTFVRLSLSISAFLLSAHVCWAQSFPVTIQHQYGEALIEKKPKRVVSIGFVSHDFVLSLGIKPVGLRRWYGKHPYGVWPWAQAALGDAKPVVMWGSINVEQIAALKPDLIVAIMSGLTRQEYAFLSNVAPTIMGPVGSGAFDTPWQTHTRLIAKATGLTDKAETMISAIEARINDVRANNKQWQGMSASIWWAGGGLVYASFDPRARFLEALGFKTPPAIDAMVNHEYEFYATPSDEFLPDLDTDILVWLDPSDNRKRIRDLPLRKTLRAWREGREVYMDAILSSALAHSSPLSLHYVLDHLVPLLSQASDADPRTRVDSMHKAGLLKGQTKAP